MGLFENSKFEPTEWVIPLRRVSFILVPCFVLIEGRYKQQQVD
jgi:hypothetical protein